jgi:hypothetical protein
VRQNGSSAGDHRGDASAVLTGGDNRGNNNGVEEKIARLIAENVLTFLGFAIMSGLGECNVRQAHHLMLAGAAQINMAMAFVSTASCMPGMMKGVSCTVLRLNWRRKDDEGVGNGIKDGGGGGGEQWGGGAGTAGTWLFDCGE